MPKPAPKPDASGGLPGWLRNSIVGLFAGALVVHIFVDIFNTRYEGAATSLMLGGIVGSALGLNEWLRNRGGPGGA